MRRLALLLVSAMAACSEPASPPPDGGTEASLDAAATADTGTISDSDAALAPLDASVSGVDATSPANPDAGPVTKPDAGTASIWKPAPGTSWQWQLSGTIDTTVDVEMFDVDLFETPQATIDALHAAGRIVICYFSAGSYEDWRADKSDFPQAAIGKAMDGWAGESWLDVSNEALKPVMRARLKLAQDKKCDGVEPDNMDGYQNDTGFALTAANQLAYNRFIAAEAHALGLSVGLKNDIDQLDDLVGDYDWALNEECVKYNECGGYATSFIAANKAVFHTEYGGAALANTVCPKTKPLKFSTLIKKLELDAWRVACP